MVHVSRKSLHYTFQDRPVLSGGTHPASKKQSDRSGRCHAPCSLCFSRLSSDGCFLTSRGVEKVFNLMSCNVLLNTLLYLSAARQPLILTQLQYLFQQFKNIFSDIATSRDVGCCELYIVVSKDEARLYLRDTCRANFLMCEI